MHGETGLVYNDCDKANALADVFEKVHKLTVDLSDDLTEKIVHHHYREMSEIPIDSAELPHISSTEVYSALKQTKNKKASGFDGLQNLILKNLPKKALVQIIYIFNASINKSYFPDS